jgi:histone acetyltransferase (RNA polymerase elongator complex component)
MAGGFGDRGFTPGRALAEGTLTARVEELEERIHEASEIYIGMDGFTPETAPEGYQQRILQQMYDALTTTQEG